MQYNLTDEQIIEKYRAGDENALDFLLNKYKSLAGKISRSYFLVGAEPEDILQEAMLGLYSACRKYTQDGKTSFKTFATLCINRAIQSAIKIANRQKNKVLNESLSLSSKDINGEDIEIYIQSDELKPEDVILAKERERIFAEIIDKKLSKKEKNVLKLYLQGQSYMQIAQSLDLSTKSVDNAIARTKKKLEIYLSDL